MKVVSGMFKQLPSDAVEYSDAVVVSHDACCQAADDECYRVEDSVPSFDCVLLAIDVVADIRVASVADVVELLDEQVLELDGAEVEPDDAEEAAVDGVEVAVGDIEPEQVDVVDIEEVVHDIVGVAAVGDIVVVRVESRLDVVDSAVGPV